MAETKTEAGAPTSLGAAPVQPVADWWSYLPPLVALGAETATTVVLLVELVPGGRAVWSCSKDLFEGRPGGAPWRERAAVSFDRARVCLLDASAGDRLVPEINHGSVGAGVTGNVIRIVDHFQEDATGLELVGHVFDVPRERYARILEESARILRGAAAVPASPA